MSNELKKLEELVQKTVPNRERRDQLRDVFEKAEREKQEIRKQSVSYPRVRVTTTDK